MFSGMKLLAVGLNNSYIYDVQKVNVTVPANSPPVNMNRKHVTYFNTFLHPTVCTSQKCGTLSKARFFTSDSSLGIHNSINILT